MLGSTVVPPVLRKLPNAASPPIGVVLQRRDLDSPESPPALYMVLGGVQSIGAFGFQG